MELGYYDADSLSRTLAVFEGRYSLSSEKFYELHVADDGAIAHVPGFHRQVWASFYRDVRRLTGEDFVERVERTLELA